MNRAVKSSKNILMVIGKFHPFVGGSETQALLLSKQILSRGLCVTVVTRKAKRLKTSDTIDSGLKVVRLRSLRGPLKYHVFMLNLTRYIIINRKTIEYIHVHGGLFLAVAAAIAGRMTGIDCLVKITNSGQRFDLSVLAQKGLFGRFYATMVARCATAFVAITPQISAELSRWGIPKERVVEIPNGVEIAEGYDRKPNHIRHMRQKLTLPMEMPVGVVTASLTKKKNHEILFAAFSKVAPKDRGYLVILGDGPLQEHLIRQCGRLSLSDCVVFRGAVSNVAEYLTAADYFALPSVTEGLSNAVLEAMSYCLPALVSDIPGNRYVLEGGDCLFAAPHSVSQWTDAITRMLKALGRERAYGARNRRIVRDRFEIGKVANSYLKLYGASLNAT